MVNVYILNGPEIGRSFKLRDGVMFAGRSLDNDIRIDDKTVSRKHLRIVKRGETFFVTDLKSQNGTYYDGKYLVSCYSEEVVAKVLNEKKPLIITDVQDEEIEQDLANTLKMKNIASVMCLPLVSFSELVGALYVDSLNRPYPFAPEDICFFEDIAQRTASFILLEESTSG